MIFEKVTKEITHLEQLLKNLRSRTNHGSLEQTNIIDTIIMLYESIKYGEFMNGDEQPVINNLKTQLDKYRHDVLDVHDAGHAESDNLALGTIILEKVLSDYQLTKEIKEGDTYKMLGKMFPELIKEF